MHSVLASLSSSIAGASISRKAAAPKVTSGRRASLRVSAHGGVGGSGGTPYPGKDKPFGSDQAPWKKKFTFDDPDQVDPENAGRGQRWTPPPPVQESAPAQTTSWDAPAPAAPPPPPPAPSYGGGGGGGGGYGAVDPDNIDPDFRPGKPDNYVPQGISATHGGSHAQAAPAPAAPPPPPPPAPTPSYGGGGGGGGGYGAVDPDNIDPDFRPGKPDNYVPQGISATHGGSHAQAAPAAPAAPAPAPPPPAPRSYGGGGGGGGGPIDPDNIDPDFRPGKPDNYTPTGISATHGGAHAQH